MAFIGLLVYSNSFGVPFQLDDIPVIAQNPLIRHLSDVFDLFRFDPTRFVTHFSFALNYHFHGFHVFGFHLINTLLHIACAVSVYFLIRRTLNLARSPKEYNPGPVEVISFFSALIFLVHPIQTESVTYIVQRSVLWASLFYLSALNLYLKLKANFSWRLYVLSWLIVVAGTVSKPIFVTVFLVVLLYEVCFFNFSFKTINLQKNLILFLPYLTVLFIVPLFLMYFSLNHFSETFDFSKLTYATRITSEISRGDYLLTQFRVLWTYIRLLFVPLGQNLDYDYSLSHNFFEIKTFLCFTGILALIGAAFLLFKRQRILSFCIFWFFIVLIPESSIFPIPDVIFEHRLYLAMIGFSLFLCWGMFLLIKDMKRYCLYFSFIVLSFSLLTYARNLLWSNDVVFLKDIIMKSPMKARAHNNLGIRYSKDGLMSLAESEFRRAIELDHKYINAYNNLARIYADKKDYFQAELLYKNVLLIEPDNYIANLNLGNLYYDGKKFYSAISQYKKAIDINPRADNPYVNLGQIYLHFSNVGDAEKMLKIALQNNPYYARGHYALGEFYFTQELFDSAVDEFKKTLRIDPNYADAYNMLGIVYAQKAESDLAERCFKEVIRLKPDSIMGYLNLENYYKKIGNALPARYYAGIAAELRKRQQKKAE